MYLLTIKDGLGTRHIGPYDSPKHASDDLDRVLQPFESIETPESDKRGVGLGLTLVHNIIDLHKGEFQIESKMDQGTKGIIRLQKSGPAKRKA